MKTEKFDVIIQERLKKIEQILVNKAKEYSQAGDRLHNFKVAGRIQGITPKEALWGMAVKHMVNVEDFIKGRLAPTKEMVDEKIGDLINYLILLEAVLTEERTLQPFHAISIPGLLKENALLKTKLQDVIDVSNITNKESK